MRGFATDHHWLSIDGCGSLRALCAAGLASLIAGCAGLAGGLADMPPVAVPSPQPAPVARAAEAPDVIAARREAIRTHAKAHCGSCHQSSRPSAKPAALSIYDLDRANWYESLTVSRLQGGFPRRLEPRLDAAGQRDLQAFIEHEVAVRKP